MRSYLALAIVLIIAFIITIQPAFALTETAIPFITTGCAVFTEPLSNTGLTILEFNSDSTSIRSIENLDITFPAFADGLNLGPTAAAAGAGLGLNNSLGIGTDGTGIGAGNGLGLGIGATTSANILPFGPVNLAFPDISQTAFDSIATQRTYFFTDTFS